MAEPLRVLLIEDSEDDALLLLRELERAGYDPVHSRVYTEADLREQLERQNWDLVISDYAMGEFNGIAAFEQVKATGLDVPFIIVSGHVGEERAAEAMRQGASDYILKDNLIRLIPAIRRELNEAKLRLQRARIERTLQEREHQLSSIYNTVGDILYQLEVEPEGRYRFVSVNQTFISVTGLTHDRLVGHCVDELVPEPALSEVQSKFSDAIRAKAVVRWEQVMDFPSGRLTGEASVAPMFDDAGHCTHLVGAVHDVTERKAVEQALRDSEARTAAVLNTAVDGVITIDGTGTVESYNAACQRMFGHTPEEVIGRNVRMLMPEPYRSAHDGYLDRYLETGVAGVIGSGREVEGRRKDGTSFPIDLSVSEFRVGGERRFTGIVRDISARKAVEQAQRESEQRYRQLFENAALGIIIKVGLQWEEVNVAFARMFGFESPAEIAALGSVDQLFAPHDRERIRGFAEARARGESAPDHYEFEGRRRDGTPLWVDCHVTTGRLGERPLFVLMISDITARKTAQRALGESEQRYRQLFESSVVGIVIHQDMHPTLINTAFAQIFGYDSPRELLALESLEPLQAPHERERLRGYVDARARGEDAPTQYEFEGRRKDGAQLWLDCRVTTGQVGDSTLFILMITDVTAQRSAQQALQASEQRYRSLVEGSVQGIVVHRDLRPLFANVTCAGIFGLADPKAILRLEDISELVAAEERARLRTVLTEIDTDPGMARQVDFEGHLPDGAPIGLECVNREITWAGEPAIQTALFEVSERRRLEAQLRQSQKMEAVGQLAGGLAHDFNNMLQIIQGFGELAAEQDDDPAGRSHSLDQILGASERAAVLTRQLLAFSRRQGLEPRVLNLNELITNVLKMLQRLIGENVIVETQLDPDIALARADAGAIEQCMVNLAINARDAMPNGGRLMISTRMTVVDEAMADTQEATAAGPHVRLIVADSGIGMTRHVLRRVFEPFFTTKSAGQGTGLGLAMVYGIIQQHNGMITAYSEPGRGTAIHIFLPVASEMDVVEAAEVVEEAPTGQERLLIAEDDPGIRDYLASVLRAAEYQVELVQDGEEALATFRSDPQAFDLVLLDMVMPKSGGRETYQHLAELRPGVRVLFITGFSPHLIDTAFMEGKDLWLLSKPFSVGDLLRIVRQALDA